MDFEPNEHAADGVTAGQARHNSSNVGGVTAGHVGHNSSVYNAAFRIIKFSQGRGLYIILMSIHVSPRAAESCPTTGDNRGSISPCCSLSGIPSHDVYSWSFYVV